MRDIFRQGHEHIGARGIAQPHTQMLLRSESD